MVGLQQCERRTDYFHPPAWDRTRIWNNFDKDFTMAPFLLPPQARHASCFLRPGLFMNRSSRTSSPGQSTQSVSASLPRPLCNRCGCRATNNIRRPRLYRHTALFVFLKSIPGLHESPKGGRLILQSLHNLPRILGWVLRHCSLGGLFALIVPSTAKASRLLLY
jgi:hypothetical protein